MRYKQHNTYVVTCNHLREIYQIFCIEIDRRHISVYDDSVDKQSRAENENNFSSGKNKNAGMLLKTHKYFCESCRNKAPLFWMRRLCQRVQNVNRKEGVL
ncbi:hypothetical protein ANACOL_00662 [Anaerotruncus colihominis DSM 17241]|uniref:Uncharacterized protein n=1 Tax=Anaerotruncus colihominis DSM 17241 TaxID=445972 RepID=B0P7D2_9FIRM|nr:hypothetical protein ANACOL_00662 [Anaerotruncus colihominis DSM 17241]